MEIDADRKRISLSIKALLGDEEEVEAEAESTAVSYTHLIQGLGL